MTPENLPPEEEELNPDTNTDDSLDELEGQTADAPLEALPLAEAPVAPEQEQEAPTPPPLSAGPRVFPQHFSLLFGATAVFVGAISTWERTPVFAMEVNGAQTIAGVFLMAVAGSCMIVGALNIVTGRLQGMLAAFVAGCAGLFFGIRALLRTIGAGKVWAAEGVEVARGWLGKDDLRAVIENTRIDHAKIEQAMGVGDGTYDPAGARDAINAMLSQIAPGVWLTLLGSVIIVLVFVKAVFGGKKQPAPAPAKSRRGRR